MNDKLDLLGVRYDCEMEQKMKYQLAKDISDFWKVNCLDEDFYDNCMNSIMGELGQTDSGLISDEVYEIWNIIEKEFI